MSASSKNPATPLKKSITAAPILVHATPLHIGTVRLEAAHVPQDTSRSAVHASKRKPVTLLRKPMTAPPIHVRATPTRIGPVRQEAAHARPDTIRMAIPANPMMPSTAAASTAPPSRIGAMDFVQQTDNVRSRHVPAIPIFMTMAPVSHAKQTASRTAGRMVHNAM